MSEKIIHVNIPFNRKWAKRKLFGAFILMAAGFLYLFLPFFKSQYQFNGYFFIFISLLITFHSARRLFASQPGILLDPESIRDHTTAFWTNTISWSDITNVRTITYFWQKLIVIDVQHPQAYINRQKNVLQKLTLSLNELFYGSPFCINPRELDISINDLLEALKSNLPDNKTL